MHVLFKKVCGLDVHKGNIVASIVWEEDRGRFNLFVPFCRARFRVEFMLKEMLSQDFQACLLDFSSYTCYIIKKEYILNPARQKGAKMDFK